MLLPFTALHAPHRAGRFLFFIPVMLAALIVGTASASVYVPENGQVVLARLPANSEIKKLDTLRETVRNEPDNLRAASHLARRYIQLTRRHSDPRFLGYATAITARWLQKTRPAAEMLVLQAIIEQRQHDFDSALGHLAQVLKQQPTHPQALLTQAAVLRVQGRLDAAAQSCTALARIHPGLGSLTCLAGVNSLRGQLTASYQQLESGVQRAMNAPQQTKSWSLGHLAEMAARKGNKAAARQHLEEALKLSPNDSYVMAAYCDLLLDEGRPGQVLEMLQAHESNDALLLRLAIAGAQLNDPRADEWRRELSARFEAARLRGDTVHLREQARFALELQNKPDLAAELARRNWEQQHEPDDLLILLKAALAANRPEYARPALQWVDQHGYEDIRIGQHAS